MFVECSTVRFSSVVCEHSLDVWIRCVIPWFLNTLVEFGTAVMERFYMDEIVSQRLSLVFRAFTIRLQFP
jgi:hypothetical protein